MHHGILTTCSITALFLGVTTAGAAERYVPGDHDTIQAAIDASVNGDVVTVGPGTWPEQINFNGRNITVRSSDGAEATVLDGSSTGSVVTINSGESEQAALQGFTLANGWMTGTSCSASGALLEVSNASPLITECIFFKSGGDGTDGDISIQNQANPTISNCLFPDGATTYVICFANLTVKESEFRDADTSIMIAHYGGNMLFESCTFTDIAGNDDNGLGWAWWDATIEFDACTFTRINWDGARKVFNSTTPDPAYGVFSNCIFNCHVPSDITGTWYDNGGNNYIVPVGDSNLDRNVDIFDLLIIINNWGQPDSEFDQSGDGSIGVDDLLIILSNWDSTC
ncbi:MAG: hypothetical protein P8K80_06610 [Phycisphaerales bacterium]|nr:hypothetical protein [Phycisphaerales bacterium]